MDKVLMTMMKAIDESLCNMTDLVSDNLSQLYSLLWFEHLTVQSMVHIYTPLAYLSL